MTSVVTTRDSADDAARLPEAAIFDLDGTLCDVRLVRKYVVVPEGSKGFKRDFDRFHRESLHCPPHTRVKEAAKSLRDAGFRILIVSGREERWSNLTRQWLARWDIEFDAFFLRPAKDYRPDNEIKSEIGRLIRQTYIPIAAFDDRDDIIGVWQELGIATIRVRDDGELEHASDGNKNIPPAIARLLPSIRDAR